MVAVLDERPDKRGLGARLGVTALNLLVPGLGLLRLNEWRAGLLLLVAPFIFAALFTFGFGNFPVIGFYSAIFALVLALALLAAVYIVPMVMTWRRSRTRSTTKWWSRWYSLAAIAIVILVPVQLVQPAMHHFYKGYYLPSESMAPTVEKNDKVVADMRWRGPPKRGEIIIFKGPDSVRISRIVAIEGDRIAMRDGMPLLNGIPATQTKQGPSTFAGYLGIQTATALIERLPGEALPHRILDAGPFEFDSMREAIVPKGHFFVLGDNRDSSADSRVPLWQAGVGMVPLDAIIGRAMYIYWSDDHAKIGARLDK